MTLTSTKLGLGLRALGLCLAFTLTLSPTSQAAITGNAAWWVNQIHLHEPSPPGDLVINLGQCPELPTAEGCSLPWESTIYILHLDRNVVEHEMGHFYDARVLTPGVRNKLLRLMIYPPGTPWDNPNRWTDGDPWCRVTACPNEMFADFYSACTLQAGKYTLSVEYSEKIYRAICGVIRRAPSRA